MKEDNIIEWDVLRESTDIPIEEIIKFSEKIDEDCYCYFNTTIIDGVRTYSSLNIRKNIDDTKCIDILMKENKYILRLFRNNSLLSMVETIDQAVDTIKLVCV